MQINGVVHNNIRPSTIELIKDARNNWKCSINHFSNALLLSEWTQQTQNKIIKHYGYSSPEILNPKARKLSSKSDVFSIGVLFYFLLFNKQPFQLITSTKKLPFHSYPEIDFKNPEMNKLSFEGNYLSSLSSRITEKNARIRPQQKNLNH